MIPRAFLLACIALMGCRERFTPFERTTWVGHPTDDDLVAGIVGHSGTLAEHAIADEVVRDVLVPELRRGSDGTAQSLEGKVDHLRHLWESQNEPGVDSFVRFCLERCGVRLVPDATIAAEAKLHSVLWPSEPYPDDWDEDRARAVQSPEDVAAKVDAEIDRLEARWGPAVTESRVFATARNMARVARTGDYSVTSGIVYEALVKKGIYTMPDFKTRGPW